MKLLVGIFFLFVAVFVAAAPAAKQDGKPLLVLHGTQRRYVASELKAHHEQMRKVHKDYVPYYPDAPILVHVKAGTPPVDFQVSLETGSEALFLLGKNYPGLARNQSFFDPALSSTAQPVGDYAGFSGELNVSGTAYIDRVTIFSEITYPQRIGVVNDVDDPFFFNPDMPDGVLGLSWNPNDAAAPNENSSAILNFFNQVGWPRVFCNYMSAEADSETGRKHKMHTTFPDCTPDYCATATNNSTFPLVWLEESRSLAFQVDSFTYNDQQYAGGFGKVDSGVPNILLPYASLLAVVNDVQPDYLWNYNLYTVDCSKAGSLPDWVFTIGGKDFVVPSTAYVVDLQLPDGQCALSTFLSDAAATDYVFGYVFHDLWCVQMDVDNQEISLLDVVPPSSAEPALNWMK